MSLYADLALTADELLQEFGKALTVRHVVSSGYDPETGGSTITTTDEPGCGAKFPYGDKMIDGTMILTSDEQLYLSPVGITTPKPDDQVIIGADTYSIVKVNTTAPAGIAVIHECQIRK